jgi:hypothetical protein
MSPFPLERAGERNINFKSSPDGRENPELFSEDLE